MSQPQRKQNIREQDIRRMMTVVLDPGLTPEEAQDVRLAVLAEVGVISGIFNIRAVKDPSLAEDPYEVYKGRKPEVIETLIDILGPVRRDYSVLHVTIAHEILAQPLIDRIKRIKGVKAAFPTPNKPWSNRRSDRKPPPGPRF